MSDWIANGQGLKEFLSYVLVYAPNFPEEDYLEDSEQMTLTKAFEEIRAALVFVPDCAEPGERQRVLAALSDAERAFAGGHERDGCRILQAFQEAWFGGPM